MTKPNDEPAFPEQIIKREGDREILILQGGMALRDFFAHNAPLIYSQDTDGDGAEEPPYWFQFGEKPPKYPDPQKYDSDEKTLERLTEEHKKEMAAYHEARRKLDEEKFFAWRWNYADQMLKGRGK